MSLDRLAGQDLSELGKRAREIATQQANMARAATEAKHNSITELPAKEKLVTTIKKTVDDADCRDRAGNSG